MAAELLPEACESFLSGIEVLLPLLQARQKAFLPLFDALWSDYQACLEASGSEPDAQLLSRLEPLFPPEDGQQ